MTCDQSPRQPLGHSATWERHVHRLGPRSLLAAEISGACAWDCRPLRVTSRCGLARALCPQSRSPALEALAPAWAARPELLLNLLLSELRWVWWRLGTLL